MHINQHQLTPKTLKAFLVITAAVLVVGAGIWMLTADRREPASRAEMRAHMLDQITDGEILGLYEKSVIESAARTAQRAESQVAAWDERCADVAYQARNNTACKASTLGLGLIMPSASAEAVFEELLLGPCIYATSKHDAKSMGCLP